MLNVNQIGYKIAKTLKFSLFPYLGLIILFEELIKNVNIPSLLETIPAESFSFILIDSSLCIGTVGRKIFDWKYKTKEKLKAFTTTNTQSEKLQDEVKYTIELEKYKNRNVVIQKTIDLLNSNQSILNSLSNRYDINDKDVAQTKEEAEKKKKILLSF